MAVLVDVSTVNYAEKPGFGFGGITDLVVFGGEFVKGGLSEIERVVWIPAEREGKAVEWGIPLVGNGLKCGLLHGVEVNGLVAAVSVVAMSRVIRAIIMLVSSGMIVHNNKTEGIHAYSAKSFLLSQGIGGALARLIMIKCYHRNHTAKLIDALLDYKIVR